MENMNVVEQAIKVTSFRKLIREECRKKGLQYPQDDKIAEYISNVCDFDVYKFIEDYANKRGVFKEPFEEFKKNVLSSFHWVKKPTDEEIKDYVAEFGYNVNGFINQYTINQYSPLEKKTLEATLGELKKNDLVKLWNTFIEESLKYGEDSYIYDLKDDEDVKFINGNFPQEKIEELLRLKKENKNIRFFQWLDSNEIVIRENISDLIIAFWGEIFERIIAYPFCYNKLSENKYYFECVFYPCLYEMLGYTYDESNGKVSYNEI